MQTKQAISMNSSNPTGIAGGIAIMLGSKGILLGLGFVTKVLMVRYLGPELLGIYGLFIYIFAIYSSIVNLGIPNTNIHDVGRDPENAGESAGFTLIYTLCAGLLGILVFYFVYRLWLHELYFAHVIPLNFLFIFAIVMYTPAFMLRQQLNAIFLGLKRFKLYNATLILEATALLILFLVFSRTFQHRLSAAVAAWLGAIIVSSGFVLTNIVIRFRRSLVFSLANLRHTITFGFKAFLSGLIKSLILRANLFIVGYFLAPEELGFYFLASSLAEMVFRIVFPLAQVFFSYASGMDFEGAVTLINTAFRFFLYGGVLAAAISLPIVYFGIPFIFGAQYTGAVPLVLILLPGIISWVLIDTLYAFFIARDKHGRVIIAYFTTFISLCVLSVLLIPFLGVPGAAIAVSAANFTGLIVIIYKYKQLTGVSLLNLLKISGSDIQRIKSILRKFKNKYNT